MLPSLLSSGGPMSWVLLIVGAVALTVFIERLLTYHRARINTAEFLSGVRTVLKRGNTVEAISICDATPGPVPRLVKVAILNGDKGRDAVRAALEEAGQLEVPQLEARLNFLATVAQTAPVLGLLGTVLALINLFESVMYQGMAITPHDFAKGMYGGLCSTALGLAVAAFNYIAYNYLVGRVDILVQDMERTGTDALNMVTENKQSQ